MLRQLIGITTTALFGATGMSAHADSTLKFSTDTGAGAEPNTVMVSQGKVRMESMTPQGKSVMIFNDSQKHFISLNDQEKKYMVMDQSSIKEQVRMMQEMKKQWQAKMQEQMKQMSPEQRQQMEQQMAKMGMGASQPNQPPAPKFTVTKTNRTENISGVRCTVYDSFRGSERMGEACIANPEALKLSKTDYQTLKGMFAFQRNMQKQFATASGHPTAQNEMGMFDNVEGLVVKVTDNRGGIMTLGSISHDALAQELFKIPADFEKIDPIKQMQERKPGPQGGEPAGQQGGHGD
jgi:Domain of unknown function (DUF4412)